MSRSYNAKRNSVWGIINRFVLLLLPFIVRTVMIKTLGADYLGLSGLFTSILQVLSMAELGFGQALIYSMYKPVAENNTELVCALLRTYKKIYRIIGCVVLTVGLTLIPLLPLMIKSDIPPDINIYILFLIYLVNSIASYWLFAYKISLLNVNQRNDVVSKITTLIMASLYCLQIVVLLIFKNYYIYIILMPISTILINLIASFYASKMYPEYQPAGIINPQLKGELKKSISGLMVVKLSSVSRNAFDSIIVSAYISLTVVAVYNNYYYVLNAVTSFLLVFTQAIAAPIGNSMAVESIEKNQKDMNRLNFVYMWISGLCAVLMMSLYQPFMKIWVGDALMFSDSTMFLFVIYFLVIKLGDIQGQYFDAAGLWWYRRPYAIIEALGNLLLNFILGYFWGVNGILIATIVTTVVFNFIISSQVIFARYFHKGYSRYVISQGLYVIISLLVSIVCLKMNEILFAGIKNIYFLMFIRLVVCIVLSNVIFLVVYFKTSVFKDSTKWLRDRLLVRK